MFVCTQSVLRSGDEKCYTQLIQKHYYHCYNTLHITLRKGVSKITNITAVLLIWKLRHKEQVTQE